MNAAPADSVNVAGVPVMSAGPTPDGDEWDVNQFQYLVEQFEDLGPNGKSLLNPPLVVASVLPAEGDERTDMPVSGLRVQGETLFADVANVPAAVGQLLSGGQFDQLAVEYYDDFADDSCRSYGMALRRVVVMGPAIAAAAGQRMPGMKFGERQRNATTLRTISMDRDTAAAAIAGALPSMDSSILQAMTDDQLLGLYQALADVGLISGDGTDQSAADSTGGNTNVNGANPNAPPAFSERDVQVQRVRKFAESPTRRENLAKVGKTPSDYVATFKRARMSDPSYTAVKHGVPAGIR